MAAMRVLVVTNLYPPRALGGYERSCEEIAKMLRIFGHTVTVLTSPCPQVDPTVAEGLTIRALGLAAYERENPPLSSAHTLQDFAIRTSQLCNTYAFLHVLRTTRPDHVMFFNLVGIGGLALLDLACRVGVPWSINLGDTVPFWLRDSTITPVLDLYHASDDAIYEHGQVIAVSQMLLDNLAELGVQFSGRVHIVPRGVPNVPAPPERQYRVNGHTRFVQVGTLSETKGIPLTIDAVAQLVDQGVTDFQVECYGPGDRLRYEQDVEARGLGSFIRFHGEVSRQAIDTVYAEADALLFPTWEKEAWGKVAPEALAFGCVPIMSGRAGCAEWLVDDYHVLKIQRTPEALAAAMRRVCTDEVDLAAFGRRGQKLVTGPLSLERTVRRLEAIMDADPRPGWDADLDSPSYETDVTRVHDDACALLYATFDPSRPFG